ncbi:MAG: hypothetical protein HY063_08955 [Bacteroidetes bacterium]|nr:hypothetical protein [Bacteroidota bacterium]
MVKKIISFLLRLIIGGTFIASAYAKLYPVEIFEMKFVETNLIGWNVAPFIARFFIAIEFMLGAFLILNISFKFAIKSSIAILLFFSFYLLYVIIFQPQEEDCGCFGIYLKMSPQISLLKNVVLLAMSFLLLRFNKTNAHWKFLQWVRLAIIVSSLALPFILNPVFAEMPPNAFNADLVGKKLDTSALKDFTDAQGNKIDIQSGKKIICFFSMQCRFCKLTAKKIGIIQKKLSNEELPIYFVFWGEEKNLSPFMKEAKTENVPSQIASTEIFFKLSGSDLPSVYFLEDGVVKKKLGFLTFTQEEVEQFLNL